MTRQVPPTGTKSCSPPLPFLQLHLPVDPDLLEHGRRRRHRLLRGRPLRQEPHEAGGGQECDPNGRGGRESAGGGREEGGGRRRRVL